jgi:hypothetical protein
MVKGIARPYHPWGLGGSWLTSPRRWGIDPQADSPGHPSKEHTVLECLHVILEEDRQHHRYAVRDLQVLEKRPRQTPDTGPR